MFQRNVRKRGSQHPLLLGLPNQARHKSTICSQRKLLREGLLPCGPGNGSKETRTSESTAHLCFFVCWFSHMRVSRTNKRKQEDKEALPDGAISGDKSAARAEKASLFRPVMISSPSIELNGWLCELLCVSLFLRLEEVVLLQRSGIRILPTSKQAEVPAWRV